MLLLKLFFKYNIQRLCLNFQFVKGSNIHIHIISLLTPIVYIT